MPLHFARPPEASTNALEAALPAVARRASIATHAPAINSGIVSHLRRRRGEAPAAAREPIAAPVHVIGLDQIAAQKVATTTPKLWTYMLHADDDEAPAALADIDLHSHAFSAVSEGPQITSLGRRIRSVEADSAASDEHYDVSIIRVPALYLTAMWLKGRDGRPDVVIPEASPKSPLIAGKRYSLEQFNAELKPVAERLLAETDPEKGG
ncbi:hypothetical protein [Phenylobacterium sp.]|uniref:hypothetical protein n=1 Tax=Phenylobacterium sp. TaxID=1871053 RepID=UPI0035B18213